ncbi:monovalent cation/H+ antiporter complex subunit F [Intrasporangium flavum]|uniref:monovalent cation/H+ antiporter complex subunit F n=1 Tax=Intrasporangium flavum TaxID=1428657 RepID=UPI001F610197|nr:monovalent cation/H+ antiporter complex subunit F [Intrasporangium flavum]
MNTIALAALAMLGAAAVIVLVRIARGPSNLDRIVASDILLVVVIAGVALESVRQRTATYLPLLMVLGLVAFVGGVAVTRFLSRDRDAEPDAGPGAGPAGPPTTGRPDPTDPQEAS